MRLNRTPDPLDRSARIGENDNWDKIEDNLKRVDKTVSDLVLESGGTSNLEVVQARGGKPVLNDRLNSIDSRLADEATQRENAIDSLESKKANKDDVNNQLNDISVYQINKNKGKLDETFMSDKFLQQMAGNTPVNAIPGKNSLVNNQLTEKAVTMNKTNFVEVVSDNLFNSLDVLKNSAFSVNTGLPNNSNNNNLSGFIPVNNGDDYSYKNVTRVGYYDDKYDFISYTQLDMQEVTEKTPNNATYIRAVVANSNLDTAQINKGSLKDFDFFNVRIPNYASSNELARVLISSNAPYVPNVNTQDNRVEFYAPFFIVQSKTRIQFDSDITIPLDGAGAHQYILYNTKTKSFRALRSSQEKNIDENELLLMMINRKTAFDVYKVFASFAYTVDGVDLIEPKINDIVDNKISQIEEFGNDTAFAISTEDIEGWYEADENETYDLFDYDTTKSNDMNAVFEALETNHPDFLTIENLGKDSSDEHYVFKIKTKPIFTEVPNYNKPKPKILIVSGLHAGSEKVSIFSVYYFLKHLCEDWQNDKFLEYLRHNVEFEIIYNANPWGFDGGDFRRNYNMVDLNRNFDYNWSEHGEGTNTYTGPYAFSEVEAQYVRDMILNNLDAMFFIDYHTNGSSGDDYDSLMWISLGDGPINNDNATNAARYTISKATREFVNRYNQPSDEGIFGYTTKGNSSRLSRSYALSQGVPACTLECMRKFPNDQDYNNPNAVKASTEYLINFLLNLVKEFRYNNVRKIG